MKKRIPEASVSRSKKTITYKGITTYSNIFRNVTVSDRKYVLWPKRAKIIDLTVKNPWERMPDYLQQSTCEHAINRLVDNIGMNPHYNDTLKNPYTE